MAGLTEIGSTVWATAAGSEADTELTRGLDGSRGGIEPPTRGFSGAPEPYLDQLKKP